MQAVGNGRGGGILLDIRSLFSFLTLILLQPKGNVVAREGQDCPGTLRSGGEGPVSEEGANGRRRQGAEGERLEARRR